MDFQWVYVISFLVLLIFIPIVLRLIPQILPYNKKPSLLTPAEKALYGVLQLILQDKYLIFPQVGLGRIIEVDNTVRKTYTFSNRIDRKSIDFVVFSKNTLSPLLAIELDDSSHNLLPRQFRDNFVDRVMAAANLPILHVKWRPSYDVVELKKLLEGKGIVIS